MILYIWDLATLPSRRQTINVVTQRPSDMCETCKEEMTFDPSELSFFASRGNIVYITWSACQGLLYSFYCDLPIDALDEVVKKLATDIPVSSVCRNYVSNYESSCSLANMSSHFLQTVPQRL